MAQPSTDCYNLPHTTQCSNEQVRMIMNTLTGEPKGIGYSEEWLRRVVSEKGNQLKVTP